MRDDYTNVELDRYPRWWEVGPFVLLYIREKQLSKILE